MQPITKRSSMSDDEDDLESLRLAALQSLRRPAPATAISTAPIQIAPKPSNPKTYNCLKNQNKRGRGFHGGGRSGRNGAFNRIRNSNLISVQTIEPEQTNDAPLEGNRNKKFAEKVAPKLILPQDRYCNTKAVATESKIGEASSKFDRYNDSDNSDSESDSDEENTSETESPKKLERVNSLEALMQELENEIQGEAKLSGGEAKPKAKVKKSRKSKEVADSELSVIDSSDDLCTNESETKATVEKMECSDCGENKVSASENQADEEKVPESVPLKVEVPVRRKSKSPVKPPVLPNMKRPPLENRRNPVVTQPIPNLPYISSNVPVTAPLLPFQPMQYSNYSVPLNHAVPFEPPVHYNYPNIPPIGCPSPPQQMFSPGRYERPISPLTIKTDILNTITAPLSPRSAAFVLQNREIVERRKKSPRRSYSRSPSPEFRRSVSPRYRRTNSRSPSPSRQRLSPNRRVSPLRRASPISRRTSPNIRRLSPSSQPSSRRGSPSVTRYRVSPPKRPSPTGRSSPKWSRRSPPRSNVRNRLGAQAAAQSHNKPEETVDETERRARKRSRSISLSLSPSPERFSLTNSPSNKEQETSQVDPVLEARRRKFEVNGAVPTAGIIRLKPKSDDEERLLTEENDDDQKSDSQPNTVESEDLNEEELLAGEDTYIDFNVRVDDLFSDEESDNENEGRFKSTRQQAARGVAVVPFTQLLNGSNNAAKGEASLRERRSLDRDRERRNKGRRERAVRDKSVSGKNTPDRTKYKEDRDRGRSRATDRPRSRSPLRTHDSIVNSGSEDNQKSEKLDKNGGSAKVNENVKKETGLPEKRPLKGLLSLKVDVKPERRKPPIVSPIENKKIEIKIRNPSKYEVENRGHEGLSKNKTEEVIKDKKSSSRKVEVANELPVVSEEDEEEFDELDPEVIVENEEDEDEDIINKNDGAGDLRAQLSRKRAERQNKLPKVEGVPSRLLQNALQGAVFKKSKKSKSKKKEKEAAPVDDVDASVYAAIRRTTDKAGYGVADNNCSTANKERKVRVLHCDADPLPVASDGKLPIHLRLGIPGNLDLFTDAKPHKKTSRKRSKNRGSFDQV